jgi:hypothetical protein
MRLADDMRALLRQRRSNCRSFTMWRILLHFAIPADIFGVKRRKNARCTLRFGKSLLFWLYSCE